LEAGIVRGCGWQHIGAFVNLGAYDLVAAPIAVLTIPASNKVLALRLTKIEGKGIFLFLSS
jgi:hypothetical protein